MRKRIQIVARLEPELRTRVARVVKRQKTTLNAVVEAALRAYVDRLAPHSASEASPRAAQ